VASAANYTEIVFAKQATDVVFELMVTVEDPLADPSISDEARFTTWLSITVSNPSDRRLALHYIGYSGWVHDYEAENGSAPDRRAQDDVLLLPDGTPLLFYRAITNLVPFPEYREFVEPRSQATFTYHFDLGRYPDVLRFDATRSVYRYALGAGIPFREVEWFHHVLVQVMILGVPTDYEETTPLFYLATLPIIDREVGFELG